MKKLLRLFVLLMALTMLGSAPVQAAPKGYKVVRITKKNASKYFTFRKGKLKDEFGDYAGYRYYLYSKMRKKGYFVYDISGLALKTSYKYRFKVKYKKKWYKFTRKATYTFTNFISPVDYTGTSYNYSYAKIYNVKFKKAKGTVIFIEPKNVIGIEKKTVKKGGSSFFRIKLRYPYDENTNYKSHTDETTGKTIIDYYYVEASANPYNSILDIDGSGL